MIASLMTHCVARREGKPPYFFSRYNFRRMRERGNTHFCFACSARCGYLPDKNGKPTNVAHEELWAMDNHAEDHAPYVIGDAENYSDAWSWLGAKITPEFPYVVCVT